MYIFQQILLALGGVTLFLIGLKYMSDNMENLAGQKMKNLIQSCTKNKYAGVLTGAISTAVVQSSIATNVILVGLVSNGVLTFLQASSVIMGTNIGTTITAQLVSLSGKEAFSVTSIGALSAFIGFILSFFKNQKLSSLGGVMMGFGMLFLGLNIVSDCANFFKTFEEFRNIFLVESNILLLLNGLLITAIVQSSSAVTSIIIILASNGLLGFDSSIFLILGANIGTCLSVIVASFGKSIEARQTAVFNLAFNVVGALILFVPLSLFSKPIAKWFMSFSGGIERQIANFHTLFNLLVSIILLPFLKPFTNLITLIVKDNKKSKQKVRQKVLVSVKNA